MSQSTTILAYLTIGFIIYVTAKGELPSYSKVFFG